MIFTDEEILSIKNFCQSIIDRPLALDKQECVKRDGYVWCADWWTIEICKFLFNGEEAYAGDPPPNRLKNNPLFNKEHLVKSAKEKLAMLELLKANKDMTDNLFICEVGRGIDVVLAKLVKEWKITCYDSNNDLIDYVKVRFPMINARVENSGSWDPDSITETTIVISHRTMIGEDRINKLRANEKVFQIIDGRHDGGES